MLSKAGGDSDSVQGERKVNIGRLIEMLSDLPLTPLFWSEAHSFPIHLLVGRERQEANCFPSRAISKRLALALPVLLSPGLWGCHGSDLGQAHTFILA